MCGRLRAENGAVETEVVTVVEVDVAEEGSIINSNVLSERSVS